MTAFAAYFPLSGQPANGPLARQRRRVQAYARARGRVVAEFLDASGSGREDSVVLREACRYCREHGVTLLVAADTPALADQSLGGPLSSTVLPSGSSM